MVSRRTRAIRVGALGVVGLGLAFLMGASLISRPSSVSSTSPVSAGDDSWKSPPPEPPPGLVIHEWGTFLGMSGSDGSSLDGMYHEEHALPAFVHSRSRDQLRLPGSILKGETPVIYFYTDRPQSVRIGVRFPKGAWTQWYPQAVLVEPLLVQGAESPDRPGIGNICWHADILPPSLVEHRRMMKDGDIPSLPTTSAEALWNFARNVDAAYVRCLDGTKTPAASEYERFLFYRGLGEARLPLRLDARQGGTLASAGQDGAIRLWNLGSGSAVESDQPARILQGHAGPVFGVAFSPDGTFLTSAGDDGTVRLWDLRTAPAPRSRVLQGHQQAVRCVAFHPRQNVLASAGADRTVRLWDASTGRELLRFGDFGNRMDGIAFSPDGGRIATACLDRSVRLWDAMTGGPLAAFPGHAAPVFSVTFSPDGKKLASASHDSTVKVWDLTSEPAVRLLSLEHEKQGRSPGPTGWVGGLAFRPDGLELATGGTDQALAVRNLATARANQAAPTG
jgi:hypothetical protein